jgi:uncharacterized membrane protein
MIILDISEFIVSFFLFSFGLFWLSIAVVILYIVFSNK